MISTMIFLYLFWRLVPRHGKITEKNKLQTISRQLYYHLGETDGLEDNLLKI